MWSNEHCVLVTINVDCAATLNKSLHLFVHMLIYKISASQICSEDSLVNAYKVL